MRPFASSRADRQQTTHKRFVKLSDNILCGTPVGYQLSRTNAQRAFAFEVYLQKIDSLVATQRAHSTLNCSLFVISGGSEVYFQ